MRINEVDPRNYDSDIDYYNALRRSGRRPSADDFDPEDEAERRAANRPMSQADIEDEISQQRQAAAAKFAKKREVKWVDQEGTAPFGPRTRPA